MQQPTLWNWFIGGSAGYLVDFDEAFYTAHVGVDTPYKLAGFDTAIFLEGGYTKKNEDSTFRNLVPTGPTTSLINPGIAVIHSNLEIVPLTLNLKLERQLTGSLSYYLGGGLGIAFTDFDASIDSTFGPNVKVSKNDVVFAAQAFAGLVYNFNPHFEVFGGARWIYVDTPNYGSIPGTNDLDFSSDALFELGARYTF